MNDLQRAKAWLERDKLRYMDMLELLRRGSADPLYAWDDGVLLLDTESRGWYEAADSRAALERMLPLIPKGADLFSGHEVEHRDYAAECLGLTGGHACYQTAWLGEEPPALPPAAPPLVRLGQEWAEFVEVHYGKSFGGLSYIRGVIDRGVLGVFVEGELAGFMGTHDEGSLGLLEVLPAYRRRGLGEVLLIGAVRQAMEEGRHPFGQVIEGNEASLALQQKVGMTVCGEKMYWLF